MSESTRELAVPAPAQGHAEAAESTAHASLKQRVVRASVWTLLGYGAQQAVRLAANLILTRLLFPEMFGLMALVTSATRAAEMFSDVGVGWATIRDDRGDDPEFLNTAWTIQVLRGFALTFVLWTLARPLAAFYHEPLLGQLLLVAACGSMIRGFASIDVYGCQRHMRLGLLNIVALATQIITLVVMIAWAYFYRSIWALVGGGLFGALVFVALSHCLLGEHRTRFHWDQDAAQRLFSFGKWVLVTTLLTYLARQCDRFILGTLIPMDLLGVFSVAAAVVLMMDGFLARFASQVLFPTLSRLKHLPRAQMRSKLLRRRLWALLAAALLLSPIVVFGDWIVFRLYDKRYHAAGWMLRLLCLGLWPQILVASIRPALVAIGQPQYNALGQFLRFATIAVGIPLGFHLGGFPIAVAVLAAAGVPNYLGTLIGLVRHQLTAFRQDALASFAFASFASFFLMIRFLSGHTILP